MTSTTLGALLDDVVRLLTRYVVLAGEAAHAIALWVAHAHAVEAWDVTPYLCVTSPDKRCGKTRLLEVLETLVPRPWRVVRPSEAVLFRKIERDTPTLLLDETDAIFRDRSESTEGLRALLNAGNRRGAVVARVQGKNLTLCDFSVFCPKVLAGIGDLPDTVSDRGIPIRVARKRHDETAARFRRREAEAVAAPLREALATWAAAAVGPLRDARPTAPEALNDRAEEGWEPLLAIADLAGEAWASRAREAALVLHAAEPANESNGVALLRAVAAVFTERDADRILTHDLLHALVDRDGEPWGAWWEAALDKGETRGPGHKLAKLLKPYGIESKTLRVGDARGKGFERADFADAFSRYLNDVTTGQPLSHNGFQGNGQRDTTAAVTSSEDTQSLGAQGLSPCHVVEPGGEHVSGDGGAGEAPVAPCPTCGERAWWWQASGARVCGVCHPPVPPRRAG